MQTDVVADLAESWASHRVARLLRVDAAAAATHRVAGPVAGAADGKSPDTEPRRGGRW